MIHLFERLLNLRQGDLRRGGPLVLYLFLIISSLMMSKVARDALFLDEFEAIHLPYVDLAITVIVVFVMAVYLRIGRNISLYLLVVGSLWFFAITMMVFWWLVHYYENSWIYPVFYVWIGIFGVLATSQVWTLANYLFTTREAKRLVGVLGGGAIAGAIIGGSFSTSAKYIGTENLLVITAISLVICSWMVKILWHSRQTTLEEMHTSGEASIEKPQTLGESIRLIWNSAYLLSISGVICLGSVVTALVGWQFKAIAKAAIPDVDEFASFLGGFIAYTSMLGLVVQLLLTSRLLRRLGLGITLLILPVALTLGSSGVLLLGSLGSIIFLRGADSVIRYSVERSSVEMLYLPVPSQIKLHVKSFIDTVVWRLGDGFGGVVVLVFATLLQLSPYQLSWINLMLLCIWLFAVLVARRHYVTTLSANIQQYQIDTEQTHVNTLERVTADVLTSRLNAGNPKEILYALDIFDMEHHDAVHPAVRDLLSHTAPEVRQKSLAILNAAGDTVVLPQVDLMLKDEDILVRTEALLFLAHHAHVDPLERIQELGNFPNFSVRSAMVAYLAWPGKMQNVLAAQTIMETMIQQQGPDAHDTRLEAARLIAILPDYFENALQILIDDEDHEVSRQAIRSVRLLQKKQLLPIVIERLGIPSVVDEAVETIGAFDDEVIELLKHRLEDKNVAIEIRREIPHALLLIGTPAAEQILIDTLLAADPSLRTQVIMSLNTLHQRHPDFELNMEMIDTVLLAEIMGTYRSYQILGALMEVVSSEDSIIIALRESMNQRLERIFQLIALQYPEYDLGNIHTGFQSDNHLVQDNTLELLDNILKPEKRNLLIPLLDREVTEEERVKLADETIGIAMEGPEQALTTLMTNEDPWLISCAVYTIGTLELRSLEAEVDKCLDHENLLLRETAQQAKMRLKNSTDATE